MSATTRSQSEHKASRFYRPELDLLRFLAFMSVFFCHGLPFTDARHANTGLAWRWMQDFRESGNFGVCLFFLLSSYLITELLRREYLQTTSIHLKAFYLRRSLRIWPLYFAVLAVVACIGLFVPSQHMSVKQLLAYLLFAGNWYLILSPATVNPLSWLWSISVEEQFYIVWPTLAKLGGARAITIGSLLCLPISLIAIVFVERYQQHPDVAAWLNSLVQFQFFAWGALLAVFLAGRTPNLSRLTRLGAVALGVVCWLTASSVCMVKQAQVDPGAMKICIGYLLVAVGCMAFLLAALGANVSRVPSVFIYLGKISYGLYVFHELALATTTGLRQHFEQGQVHSTSLVFALFSLDRVIGLGLTIALAALSYKFLETPFLKLKDRFTFVRSRPV